MIHIDLNSYLNEIVLLDRIERNKEFDKISKIHKYWSRKPWYLIERSINEFSKKGDVILDPFIGSGTVALECMLNEREVIGYDLNPFACFLTETLIKSAEFNEKEYQSEVDDLMMFLNRDVLPLYELSEDKYILYWYSGKNKPSSHNAIITNKSFKGKEKELVDLSLLERQYSITKNVPLDSFPKEFYKDRFSYKGYTKVSDFYSSRNLAALSLIDDFINHSGYKFKDLFKLAFTNTVLHASYLKGENVRPLGVNNYWIPDDHIQENVVWRYCDRLKNVKIAKTVIEKRWVQKGKPRKNKSQIYNKSSIDLAEIGSNSVDYIITDPPYGDVIQYSELSFVWNSWLKHSFNITDEVIINPKQKKGEKEFLNAIKDFVQNSYRVLKNEGKFTLCFQNKNVSIWYSILEMIDKIGFELEDVKIYETIGSTFNQNWAKYSPQNDLYITFKKNENKETRDDYEYISVEVLMQEILNFKTTNSRVDSKVVFYDLFIASIIHLMFSGVLVKDVKKYSIKSLLEIISK